MHSHHLSKAVALSSVALFLITAQTFAATTGSLPETSPQNGAATSTAAQTPTTTTPTPVAAPAPIPTQPAAVTAADLTAAGFTEVVAIQPTGNSFLLPVRYFRVKETVSAAHPEWAGAANIVAVVQQVVPDRTWLYNAGQLEMVDLAGRSQARVSVPGTYIVVTGPDATKVVTLANSLKSR